MFGFAVIFGIAGTLFSILGAIWYARRRYQDSALAQLYAGITYFIALVMMIIYAQTQ